MKLALYNPDYYCYAVVVRIFLLLQEMPYFTKYFTKYQFPIDRSQQYDTMHSTETQFRFFGEKKGKDVTKFLVEIDQTKGS